MKNLIIIFFLLSCVNSFCQKNYFKYEIRKHHARLKESKKKGTVILSLDTIFNKGIPHAVLEEKKRLPFIDFALYSLNHDMLAYIQSRLGIDGYPYYAFNFTESGNVAEIDKYDKMKLEKIIVENALINIRQIDPFNETNFLIKFPRKFSNPGLKAYITDSPEKGKLNTTHIYQKVVRNREAEFYFKEGEIIQDYKIIGSYKILDSLVRFYLPNGLLAAACEKQIESGRWIITSLRENKTMAFAALSDDPLRELIKFLLDRLYL